jgi:predicted O-linked N-acetylglucosamine transferase (SPINDLY family)
MQIEGGTFFRNARFAASVWRWRLSSVEVAHQCHEDVTNDAGWMQVSGSHISPPRSQVGRLSNANVLAGRSGQSLNDPRDATGENGPRLKAMTIPVSAQVSAKLQQALAYFQQGNLARAANLYEEILKSQPKHLEALFRLGAISGQTKNPKKALILFDKALKVDPGNAAAFNNKGLALQELERWEAALASYNQAIAIKADYAIAYYNRANVLKELARLDAALASYDQAIAIKTDFAEAYYNRGVVLHGLGRLDAAIASYNQAVAIRRNYVEAFFNRGNILRELTQWDASLASYDQAIAIRPNYAEAYLNRGDVLHALRESKAALASYDQAIALKAGYAKAYLNRGNIFRELKQLDAALASYRQAVAIAPALEFLFGTLRYTRMQVCDWGGLDTDLARLTAAVERGETASPPFGVLALSDSAALQKTAAQIWVRTRYPLNRALPPIPKYPEHERIRIGYFSADFQDHATSYLIAQLIEMHDRSRFEVIAFSFGPESQGAMRMRLVGAFDDFIDVRRQTDSEVAMLARNLHVDIAVDLKGFTQDSRPGIFALRAAPLQVNYLGYPGTMGADYMDYLIADRTLVPIAGQPHYVEKIVYLPESYQVNDGKRVVADKSFTRAELGLPPTGFVFCCFNNNFKIMPATFDCWMRILRRVEGSVLWLFADNPAAVGNLQREAALRGVSAERLVFANRLDLPEHLARHRAADLFIDTWPCNAHTTASDALWAGLPVLTCAGESFASRVAASLLTAIRLPELIASTPQHYEELAVSLATDPQRLAHVRQKLADNRLSTPLFDTHLYVKHIEAAYTKMYEHYQAGMPAGHIYL